MTQAPSNTVLVTGAAGYIGSVVSMALVDAGYQVVGLDNLSWGGRSLLELLRRDAFRFVQQDLRDRDRVRSLLAELRPDSIVHLAAIVGDPACKLQPELARSVNVDATRALYESAERAQVRRFVFASTCSNYGLNLASAPLAETAPLNPLSLYAETKVEIEQRLLASAASCQPVILRFATAHGLSTRMRFDLTINEFTKAIVRGEPLSVYDADTWRPYCHVSDFGRVVTAVVGAQLARGPHVFDVGSDPENHRKLDLVQRIVAVTGKRGDISYVGDGKDRRNYRVSFHKLFSELGTMPAWSLDRSVLQIAAAVELGIFERQEAIYANA